MKALRKPRSHTFAVPTVTETRRPAEPAWLASLW